MGSVWAALHLSLRSPVAVKLIEQQLLALPRVVERFEREARALATLRSPHVVQVLDYGVDAGTHYLVMELLEGETLRTRLSATKRLGARETSVVVDHVARAMTVTHAAGFVHRDLKPDNIFLTKDGEELIVKVLDFGITKPPASENAQLTAFGARIGTWHYMSPEQASGLAVDSRSDLWSLGVVAFECLVGALPFHASSPAKIHEVILREPIARPSDLARVPAGFDAWFARAVCRDRQSRFQSATELAASLRSVLTAPTEWIGQDTAESISLDDTEPRPSRPPSAMHERREEVRIPSSIPAALDGSRDLQGTALVQNASRRGALLVARRSFVAGDHVEVTLHIDSPVRGESFRANVVRVRRREDPFWRFEIGVRFDQSLPEGLVRRLESKADPDATLTSHS
jgi:serine/threonine-protein kinase